MRSSPPLPKPLLGTLPLPWALFFAAVCLLGPAAPADGYKLRYAEQYYQLYHRHMHQYPDDALENIYYLERALRSDFANPLNALAEIENEREWEKYRYLFYMHVNLELIDNTLQLASQYDKRNARFYNYPWKAANLDSLKKAEKIYRSAYPYWEEALRWAEKAAGFTYLHLPDIQYWEDELARIQSGDLDYRMIIDRHLARLERVKKAFEDMDSTTY